MGVELCVNLPVADKPYILPRRRATYPVAFRIGSPIHSALASVSKESLIRDCVVKGERQSCVGCNVESPNIRQLPARHIRGTQRYYGYTNAEKIRVAPGH